MNVYKIQSPTGRFYIKGCESTTTIGNTWSSLRNIKLAIHARDRLIGSEIIEYELVEKKRFRIVETSEHDITMSENLNEPINNTTETNNINSINWSKV